MKWSNNIEALKEHCDASDNPTLLLQVQDPNLSNVKHILLEPADSIKYLWFVEHLVSDTLTASINEAKILYWCEFEDPPSGSMKEKITEEETKKYKLWQKINTPQEMFALQEALYLAGKQRTHVGKFEPKPLVAQVEAENMNATSSAFAVFSYTYPLIIIGLPDELLYEPPEELSLSEALELAPNKPKSVWLSWPHPDCNNIFRKLSTQQGKWSKEDVIQMFDCLKASGKIYNKDIGS